MFLSGQGLDETDARGRKLSDESFLLVFNAYHEDVEFKLPLFHPAERWTTWMDTSIDNGMRPGKTYEGGITYPLQGRSMVVLMERRNSGKKEGVNKEESSKEESTSSGEESSEAPS
jgi:isoamylase